MSWERTKGRAWSHVNQGPGDFDLVKELKYRGAHIENAADLAALEEKDARETEKEKQEEKKGNTTTTFLSIKTALPYSNMDLARMATFGACIGSITGVVFGFMDGMKAADESKVLQKASSAAKGKFILEGATRSGFLFGVFFGSYHTLKYGIRIFMNPGDYTEIGTAGIVSLGAISARSSTRAALPYTAMLIGMDAAHLVMRQMKEAEDD